MKSALNAEIKIKLLTSVMIIQNAGFALLIYKTIKLPLQTTFLLLLYWQGCIKGDNIIERKLLFWVKFEIKILLKNLTGGKNNAKKILQKIP